MLWAFGKILGLSQRIGGLVMDSLKDLDDQDLEGTVMSKEGNPC